MFAANPVLLPSLLPQLIVLGYPCTPMCRRQPGKVLPEGLGRPGWVFGVGLSSPGPVPCTRWLRERPHGDISRVWPHTGCAYGSGGDPPPRGGASLTHGLVSFAERIPSSFWVTAQAAVQVKLPEPQSKCSPRQRHKPKPGGFSLTATPMRRILPALPIQSGPAAGGRDARSCEGRSAAKLSPGFGQG